MSLASEKAAKEILKSLLIPKMYNSQPKKVNTWEHLDQDSYPQKEIILQVESDKQDKNSTTEENNAIQHIPVSYLSTYDRSLPLMNAKAAGRPSTYLMSESLMQKSSEYSTLNENKPNVILKKPSEIVFMQEVGPDVHQIHTFFDKVKTEIFTVSSQYPQGYSLKSLEAKLPKIQENSTCRKKSNLININENCKSLPISTKELQAQLIKESSEFCTVNDGKPSMIFSESPNIVFVQELESSVCQPQILCNEVKTEVFALSANYPQCHFLNGFGVDLPTMQENSKCEKKLNIEVVIKNCNTPPDSSNKHQTKFKRLREREKELPVIKLKVEKKVLGSIKPLKKKKNSETKGKFKAKTKALTKISQKSVNYDDEDGEILEDGKGKRNLFQLTKLEDNVAQVAERFKIGCECSDSNCFDGLNPDNVFKHRLNIADLTKAEHDMYLMGVIMASLQNLEETCRHKERIRIRSCYAYQGKKICLTAFLYLQHATLYQMKRLRSHLKNHGVSPRIHGNHGRIPSNTFSLDIYRRATNFVQNYIEKNCVKTVPNFTVFSSNNIGNNSISGESKSGKKSNKIKIANKMTSYHLPPECTKKTVHREYKSFCENLRPSQKIMKYSTFTCFLKKQFPNVKFQKVDKKREDKSSQEPKDSDYKKWNEGKPTEESYVDKEIQTVVYVPAKTLHIAEPTVVVTPIPNHNKFREGQLIANPIVKIPEMVLNGQHFQFSGGNELQLPKKVLVGHEIFNA